MLRIISKENYSLQGKASAYLDFIRWVSAVLVLFEHMRNLFFVNYSEVHNPNAIVKIFYAVTGRGHQAVMVFFVLSGLFISTSVLKSLVENNWSWKKYLINRFSRLYVVLIPALILGLVWDKTGILLFGSSGVYSGLQSDRFILPFSTVETSSLKNFIGNLFFLQGIFTPTYGSNGPLWSLSYEFWYYITFPFLMLSLFTKTLGKKFLFGIVTLVLFIFVGKTITLYFSIWLLGFLLHLLPKPTIGSRVVKTVLFTFSGLLAVSSFFVDKFISKGTDFIVALAFSLFVYIIVCCFNTKKNQIGKSQKSIAKSLADFSYTLYLVHFPFLVFLHAWLFSQGHTKWQPTIFNIGLGLGLVLIALLYAWIIAFFTEKRTINFRKRIENILSKRSTEKDKYEVSA